MTRVSKMLVLYPNISILSIVNCLTLPLKMQRMSFQIIRQEIVACIPKRNVFKYKGIPRFKVTENKNIRNINTSEKKDTVTMEILK